MDFCSSRNLVVNEMYVKLNESPLLIKWKTPAREQVLHSNIN